VRILLLNDYGGPVGGAEIEMLALRRALRARGHEATLLSSSAAPGGVLSEADRTCFGTTSPLRTLLQSANPWAWRAVRRAVRELRPDVVHLRLFLTQLSPLVLRALRDVPTLYEAVWYRSICPLGTKLLPDGSECRSHWGRVCLTGGCLPRRDWVPLQAQMRLFRRWSTNLDLIVADSEHVRARLEADGVHASVVLWHGVRPPRVTSSLAEHPTVAFAGRLVREKGVDVLLHAFALVRATCPDARLLVAGDGPERAGLEELAARLGVRSSVEFLGLVPHADLDARLAGAWAQVAPSVWQEPFGIVVAEAMMRGTAVIASAAGGLKEIVDHGRTGLLVPPGDVTALTDALGQVLSSRDGARRLGAAASEYAATHLAEDVRVERLVDLYGELAQRGGRT